MAHACKSSTQEADAGELWVGAQLCFLTYAPGGSLPCILFSVRSKLAFMKMPRAISVWKQSYWSNDHYFTALAIEQEASNMVGDQTAATLNYFPAPLLIFFFFTVGWWPGLGLANSLWEFLSWVKDRIFQKTFPPLLLQWWAMWVAEREKKSFDCLLE